MATHLKQEARAAREPRHSMLNSDEDEDEDEEWGVLLK
jgi:hypothetical protein